MKRKQSPQLFGEVKKMGEINLANYSFLIVDDVRICRLNVMAILKNLGSKTFSYASNGIEAIAALEDTSLKVDCVIADFKMPGMNGLQLLKAVRCGSIKNTRRELPVAMLTGCGDEILVGLAIKLDVHTFLLKPPNQQVLEARLQNILVDDQSYESWIKPVEFYEAIDVNTPVTDLLKDDLSSIRNVGSSIPSTTADEILYQLETVPENNILARPLNTENGRILFARGTILTNRHLTQLKGLKDIGLWDSDIWVMSGRTKSNLPGSDKSTTRKKQINLLAVALEKGDLQKCTFDRLGKLSIGNSVSCMRCSTSFAPPHEIVRRHNQRELIVLLCPDCSKRDDELMCACAKLMILEGGLPIQEEKLLQAFFSRDRTLPNAEEDPFLTLRETYGDDPLSSIDIMYWVQTTYFNLNVMDNKLQCRIDRIMANPERVRLLGKTGMVGKQMAEKHAQQRLR